MKKPIKLSVEETLLKQAKKEVPNLSEFFETCLKYYMGLEQGFFPTEEAQEILDKIKELQLQLFLLSEKEVSEDALAKAEQEKIDQYWRNLYVKYRENPILEVDLMKEASKILEVDCELLDDILDSIDNHHLFFNTWEEAKEWYGDNHG